MKTIRIKINGYVYGSLLDKLIQRIAGKKVRLVITGTHNSGLVVQSGAKGILAVWRTDGKSFSITSNYSQIS